MVILWALVAPILVADDLPGSVDLRPQFDSWGLSRRQQGSRPTCSAFTVNGALEFALARRQGHGTRLSVEFLNWAANQVGKDRHDGGFFSDLWSGFEGYGLCTEADLPYRPEFNPALIPPTEAVLEARTRLFHDLRFHWIKEWDVNTGLTGEHLAAIKSSLAQGWPVCGGFRWPKQAAWIDGVLQMCAPDAVYDGHSVLLIGYEDDAAQPGGGLFRFRNSGGDGRDGRMPYAYAGAYMNDAAWVDYATRAGGLGSSLGLADTRRDHEPVRSAGLSPQAGPGAGVASSMQNVAAPAGLRGGDVLGRLTAPPVGRNRRISSNELPKWNDANLDMTLLPPGKSLEMPLLEGPGVITHLWFTSHAGRVNELDALSLRIYWDGRTEPGVEAPLGDFFAVGQGKPATVESIPVQVSPTGALSCYWRMPFAKSARLVVSNDNPDRTAGLYWQVDWTELDELPPDTGYFHARYRQAFPARAGQDYLIADLQGQGQYVGTVMSVTLGQDGWWGEGDDFFYIDGEPVPSLQGTGAEDYFNDAWGFRTRTGPWFGQPRWQGDFAGDSGVGYRWHIPDPVGFSQSLRVTLEHKGNHADDIEGFFLERPDFISSVAFWYQTGEPKPSEPLADYARRRVPWERMHLVRKFTEAKASNAVRPHVGFAGMFGARPILVWTNTQPGARLTMPFQAAADGQYAVRLTAMTGPGFGACDVELDGKVVVPAAPFTAVEEDEVDLALGTLELKAGDHELALRSVADASGRVRPVAVEMLRLLRLPPPATREVKTHHEAHFIRLAIGRAVYAYRLAYGELPESLATLVKAGLLPARYQADENNLALEARREAEGFVVKSAGPGAWTHRWQGLDARR